MDEYAVLGIPRYATVEEIKSAYRERARFVHPDRHVREDGTVPVAVQEAFIRLHTAFRTALARASAAPVTGSVAAPVTAPVTGPVTAPVRATAPARAAVTVPQQRRAPSAPSAPVPPSRSVPRFVPNPPPPADDPLLTLLTLPQRCRPAWPADALEAWALTLVPGARKHLAEARRAAEAAGATGGRHRSVATAHVLLTLTLAGLKPGRWTKALCAHVESAYESLELSLPAAVVDELPPRMVIRRRGLHLLR